MMTKLVGTLATAGILLWGSGAKPAAAQEHYPPLTEAQVSEVQGALRAMKADERGPYLRIRWFCADGSVQPPQASACAQRGGGVQHAEMSPRALALAARGFHPGTILTGTSFEVLFDEAHAHDRLVELLLEDFLIQVDDGWVLSRARYYRGARQAEDEEQAGQAFLERLLSDPDWVGRNYWLARQLVAVIPHASGGSGESVQRIRNLATEITGIEPSFTEIRIKIHSFPSESDLGAVEGFLRRQNLSPSVRDRLVELRSALRQQYDRRATAEELRALARRVRGVPDIADSTRSLAERVEHPDERRTLASVGMLSRRIREEVSSSVDGRLNLGLLQLDHLVQQRALVVGGRLEADRGVRSRAHRLGDLAPYADLAYGAGFLSRRERDQFLRRSDELLAGETWSAGEYRKGISYLSRVVEWSWATVRSRTSPTLERFVQVEPRAADYLDSALRGSALLPLSSALARLAADADRALGATHALPRGEASRDPTGVRGLNPGVAVGRLHVDEVTDPALFDPSRIYLLPETTPELRPVAGVLALDAGNLLSHVQLLARNLGIPNASVPSALAPALRELEDQEVFFAVSPLGRVVLKAASDMTAEDRSVLGAPTDAARRKVRLDTSRLDLSVVDPVPLEELGEADSGVLVGPKAGNLGALATAFPGRVAPGLALPFGMFVRHASQRPGAEGAPLEALRRAYQTAAQ
ncbi:MAG: hypothetical protein OEO23_12935, partial [Gemmatimonadota bacterium]|nr:hypothetical protein [Gemmatimonadota bacterium]